MIIDTNVSLGCWPFQSLLLGTPFKLNAHLKKEGISLAIVSSIDAIFNRDIDFCNKQLIKQVEEYPSLVPVMVINPVLANWKENLIEYTQLTKTNAVKIYPAFHSYSLSSKYMEPLMLELKTLNMSLMVQVRIEDDRTQFPAMQVPAIGLNEIIEFSLAYPENNIECLCLNSSEAIKILNETKNVFVDISYIDGLNCLPNLIEKTSEDRILFGSHSPFLYIESAKMKTLYKEIPNNVRNKICSANIFSFLQINDISNLANL
jgi:predicted TIM-barrel fold metal-dependent hydrolase